MTRRTSTYDSKVFQEFSRLNKENFHAVVHFYEDNQPEVRVLNFEERFIMLLSYANALYETEAYRRFLAVADKIIEASILEGIQYYDGEDIFLKTLYQKAQAHFFLHEYSEAEHVSSELTKMAPAYRSYSNLLFRSKMRQRPAFVKQLLASGVFLYLISLCLIVASGFLQNEGSDVTWVTSLWKIIFGISITTLLSGLFIHRIRVMFSVSRLLRMARRK